VKKIEGAIDARLRFRHFTISALVLSQIGVVAADAYAASRSNQTISLSVGASKTIVLSENPSTVARRRRMPSQPLTRDGRWSQGLALGSSQRREDDEPQPLSVCGASKLAGDNAIRAALQLRAALGGLLKAPSSEPRAAARSVGPDYSGIWQARCRRRRMPVGIHPLSRRRRPCMSKTRPGLRRLNSSDVSHR
jgi:hypothetical protein